MPAHPSPMNHASQRERHTAHGSTQQRHALKSDGRPVPLSQVGDDIYGSAARRRARLLHSAARLHCAHRALRQQYRGGKALITPLPRLRRQRHARIRRCHRFKAKGVERRDRPLDSILFDARAINIPRRAQALVPRVAYQHAAGRHARVIKTESGQRAEQQ
jgi:hypothetical protein